MSRPSEAARVAEVAEMLLGVGRRFASRRAAAAEIARIGRVSQRTAERHLSMDLVTRLLGGSDAPDRRSHQDGSAVLTHPIDASGLVGPRVESSSQVAAPATVAPARRATSLCPSLALLLDADALLKGKYLQSKPNGKATRCLACDRRIDVGAGRFYWPYDGETEHVPVFCAELTDEEHAELLIGALVEASLGDVS